MPRAGSVNSTDGKWVPALLSTACSSAGDGRSTLRKRAHRVLSRRNHAQLPQIAAGNLGTVLVLLALSSRMGPDRGCEWGVLSDSRPAKIESRQRRCRTNERGRTRSGREFLVRCLGGSSKRYGCAAEGRHPASTSQTPRPANCPAGECNGRNPTRARSSRRASRNVETFGQGCCRRTTS